MELAYIHLKVGRQWLCARAWLSKPSLQPSNIRYEPSVMAFRYKYPILALYLGWKASLA